MSHHNFGLNGLRNLIGQVPDDVLVERVVGRRMDPETGEIYHIKFKPPPEDIAGRLIQRFDDTEEKVRGHGTPLADERLPVNQVVNRLNTYHSNLDSILDVYKAVIVEVIHFCIAFLRKEDW